ncbi:uncharacterized protein LOC100176340 [Ciona intestinalis]
MADKKPPVQQLQKLPGVRSARRNLFGRDDRIVDDLERDAEELNNKEQKRFSDTWNFDAANTQPLDGRFEWDTGAPLNQRTRLLHVPTIDNADPHNNSELVAEVKNSTESKNEELPPTGNSSAVGTCGSSENQSKRRKLSSDSTDDHVPATSKSPRL